MQSESCMLLLKVDRVKHRKTFSDRAKLVWKQTRGEHEIVVIGKSTKRKQLAPKTPSYQVIVPGQKDVQFGSVAPGITSEAIVSIRSVVDADLSIRCRVADISSGNCSGILRRRI